MVTEHRITGYVGGRHYSQESASRKPLLEEAQETGSDVSAERGEGCSASLPTRGAQGKAPEVASHPSQDG